MDRETRLKRLHFRSHHRGTKEADMIIGGFFDTHAQGWNDAEIVWFEALMDEDDVDIMAWAIGSAPVPAQFAGRMIAAMQRLDYIALPQ
ncbi:MAG: succinate dehydrogenase assembly factor 2 [Sphingomonadaceae bacterium]